ncbi:DNA replication licensing factor MCM8 [Monocercomonoides exilis]|uniref:DNA replication licensing factor MCM8 n=1 Tax=Monocercomonoides exilis TaxID=2049356 RepID=UPI00355AB080|nr:DNA replication licensing factor MCM8 [Monocercomonoides exilis]|eukprot:MONOS_7929.1-p1 / transcript=MONOS_7929.1 / gene=MONOS_7929 / organism=Monocercomonoides_exilis_PA203 / gene_product=DNA replication licensing factor MCM8 / transcript_product=DNA replication licensing factor MCM8 / location=Mono_scaffold00285:66898-69786(-) / protein_length=940 / sequence_SO=supercontig / SO=protein_coding / is_pseudo=false
MPKEKQQQLFTCPYIGWDLYFHGCPPEDFQNLFPGINAWIEFFKSKYASPAVQNDAIGKYIVPFDASVLKTIPQDSPLISNIAVSNFMTRVETLHEEVLRQMRLAAHQVLFRYSGIPMLPYSDEPVLLRIFNYRPTPLRDVKSNFINKFVSIKGTVVRVGPVRPLIVKATFICARCETRIEFPFPEGRWDMPQSCPTPGCRSKIFNPDRRSIVAVDWQKIRIQEIITDFKDSGRIPRTIECELTEELVGACVPGDIACITGVARIVSAESEGITSAGPPRNGGFANERGFGRGRRGWRGRGGNFSSQNVRQPPTLFLIFIYANNITTSRDGMAITDNFSSSSSAAGTSAASSASLKSTPFSTARDAALIRRIVYRPNLFQFLVNSLAPNIYGHQIIKQGFLLALFGGTDRSDTSRRDALADSFSAAVLGPNGNGGAGNQGQQMGLSERERLSRTAFTSTTPVRSSIHMLIVGDPGMGKSQMLRAVATATPRGVYVGGNTSTSSGLTVTVVKEGGDFALEAGALILGDRGTCCIDEFDKMGQEHQALLEAMEQQSISIAKGGLVCSLSARTSVLAAANPSGGHYDRSKTVSENLRLSPMILSRFDLVFVMMDKPDAETDRKLSEHLVRMHAMRADTAEEMEHKRMKDDQYWLEGKRDPEVVLLPSSSSSQPVSLLYSQTPERQSLAYASAPISPSLNFEMPTPRSQMSQHQYLSVPSTSQSTAAPSSDTDTRGSLALLPPPSTQAQLAAKSLIDAPTFDPVPVQHLRRYIAYARAHCHPRLTEGAVTKLREYFLDLRRLHHSSDAAVVTARQLESLRRLAEARAKSELREEVTSSDAQDVIDMMRQSLYDNLANETGLLEISRATGMSRSKDVTRLARALHSASHNQGRATMSTREIQDVARGIGITKELNRLIETMNHHGILLKKPGGVYQIKAADYVT